MRYAIVNDIHFGVNGDSEFFLNELERFFQDVFFPNVGGLDGIIIAGDLWQSRTQISSITLDRAIKVLFDPLHALALPTYILYGNHDVRFRNTNKVNTIDFLGKMYSNVKVVEKTLRLGGGKSDILLCSWLSPEFNDEGIAAIKKAAWADYLIGHFEIAGHEMTPGYLCEHGMSKDIFSGFKKVISGHFHVRSNDGKIFYTSNPLQTTWADYDEEKGFHILDCDSGELTAVNNPRRVYAKIDYTDGAAITPAFLDTCNNRIIKVFVESFSTVDLQKFKKFVAAIQDVAYKVTVEEKNAFTADNQLEVGGDVKAASLRDIMTDFVQEEAPDDLKAPCAAIMASLYDRATGVEA